MGTLSGDAGASSPPRRRASLSQAWDQVLDAIKNSDERLRLRRDSTPLHQRMQQNLAALRAELAEEEYEAGTVTFFGVAVLQAVVSARRSTQMLWISMSLILAILEVYAIMAIAVGIHYPKCVYDDDCKLGSVCMYISSRGSFMNQAVCVDCDPQVSGGANVAKHAEWLEAINSILFSGGIDGAQFTPHRTGDRWDVAPTARQYCRNQLNTEWVRTWAQADDFAKCLYVQEGLLRFGALDTLVMIMAFLLVCASISQERMQQLFNRHLRECLMPPPWRSLRAAVCKVIESILGALLATICLASTAARRGSNPRPACSLPRTAWPSALSPLTDQRSGPVFPNAPRDTVVLLIVDGGDGLNATSILLNGVAISFITVIDDELPKVSSTTPRLTQCPHSPRLPIQCPVPTLTA